MKNYEHIVAAFIILSILALFTEKTIFSFDLHKVPMAIFCFILVTCSLKMCCLISLGTVEADVFLSPRQQ